jgi:hypothetical protein
MQQLFTRFQSELRVFSFNSYHAINIYVDRYIISPLKDALTTALVTYCHLQGDVAVFRCGSGRDYLRNSRICLERLRKSRKALISIL